MDFIDSVTEGASNLWDSFDLNKFISSASQAYVAIKRAGQAPPVQAGTVRTLPDGSVARVNADGSLTVVSRAGQAQTIGPNGQVYAGSTVGGVPVGLLAVGALGIVAVLLLMRR